MHLKDEQVLDKGTNLFTRELFELQSGWSLDRLPPLTETLRKYLKKTPASYTWSHPTTDNERRASVKPA